jgi:hypothetical protein
VIGVGTTSANGPASDFFAQVDVNYVSNNQCNNLYGQVDTIGGGDALRCCYQWWQGLAGEILRVRCLIEDTRKIAPRKARARDAPIAGIQEFTPGLVEPKIGSRAWSSSGNWLLHGTSNPTLQSKSRPFTSPPSTRPSSTSSTCCSGQH